VLRQIAEGVLIHRSEFVPTNAVVAQSRAGVLLIDPGVRGDEMTCLANDLRELGQPVVAGFSTHPHWDHLPASLAMTTGGARALQIQGRRLYQRQERALRLCPLSGIVMSVRLLTPTWS
jgi:glyoxylase-like metal-dependent hydrolase (beta-lactamase superfamily II)